MTGEGPCGAREAVATGQRTSNPVPASECPPFRPRNSGGNLAGWASAEQLPFRSAYTGKRRAVPRDRLALDTMSGADHAAVRDP